MFCRGAINARRKQWTDQPRDQCSKDAGKDVSMETVRKSVLVGGGRAAETSSAGTRGRKPKIDKELAIVKLEANYNLTNSNDLKEAGPHGKVCGLMGIENNIK